MARNRGGEITYFKFASDPLVFDLGLLPAKNRAKSNSIFPEWQEEIDFAIFG